MNHSGFYDINISYDSQHESSLKICERLFNFGYRTVAFNKNVILTADMFTKTKKKRKVNEMETVGNAPLDPICVPEKVHLPSHLQGRFHVYNRLTIHLEEITVLEKLNKNGNLRFYQILAICPSSHKCLEVISALTTDIDLIQIDVSSPNLPLMMTHKISNKIQEKNLFVEVQYAPAIVDSVCFENTLSFSHLINKYKLSKSIIFTSGATCTSQLRSPYDVINLGVLFGFNEGQSKAAMSSISRSLFLRAEERYFGKVPILIEADVSERQDKKLMNFNEPGRKLSKDESMEIE